MWKWWKMYCSFCKKLELINSSTTFIATDGLHKASIDENDIVSLQMIDVHEVNIHSDYVFLNTGSPHHIEMVDKLKEYDVFLNGSRIRYSDLYGMAGSNVNFVEQISSNHFALRTYERGVEDETFSCGTGATAVAIAMNATGKTLDNTINLDVKGGNLKVTFEKTDNSYKNVNLIGSATFVFEGEIEW